MEKSNERLMMFISKIKCPLCKERFRYRVNLQFHLRRNHTDIEAEEFCKKK